jgi:phosphoglycolate phosphatase
LKLDYLFSSSRCADETHSKPDPKMLFDICQQLKVQVDECVMIGDTIHDLGMAQNAGMDSIGVLCGVHSAKSLEEYGPKGIYDKVANIELTK